MEIRVSGLLECYDEGEDEYAMVSNLLENIQKVIG